MKAEKSFALITGASSGIGKEFASGLAARGYHLLLVALPSTGLLDYALWLHKKYDVEVVCIETDLLLNSNHKLIADRVIESNLPLQILINNVGVGYAGEIGTMPASKLDEMLQLNLVATTRLTNMLVPVLKKNIKAYLLNMGSFAGFMPLAYKSVYGATKHYIFEFSRAIESELKSCGIQVSVAMPGPVPTNGNVKKRISNANKIGKKMAISAEYAAKYILNSMFSGQKVIIPGALNKIIFAVGNQLPYWMLKRIIHNRFKNDI